MTFDETVIQDPREIFASVRRTAEESEREGPYRIGLRHNHTSAIRGYGERETGLGDEIETDLDYPVELTREDGGDTWYHSPESRCLMLGIPDESARNHVEYMRAWGNLLAYELEDFAEEKDLDISPEYRGMDDSSYFAGDIYDRETGKQLIGLSGRSFQNSTVVRACMYDGGNHGEEFDEIVESDAGREAEIFHDKYLPVEGFYDQLIDDGSGVEEVQIDEHLDPDVSTEKGRLPSPCIERAN